MDRIVPPVVLFLLGLSGQAHAQLIAQTSSSHWTPGTGPQQSTSGYGYSDCTSENSIGSMGELVWFQGFDTQDRGLAVDTITAVASANGWQGSTNGSPGPGAVYVYDDPGGDHVDPTDLGCPISSAAWATCCPNTDIKEVTAVPPADVSDGFWIAAMLRDWPGIFPAPFDTDTAPSNGRTWITGSHTSFDPCDPGAGIGFFDMAALGFDSHWVMSAQAEPIATPYCTAKTGLVCDLPSISFSGVPEAGATAGFVIRAQPARGQRNGMILYSCSGRAAVPFDGGLLCVAPAVRRSSQVNSGGSPTMCDGVFELDWNAFASGNTGGNPNPCLGAPGQQVNTQFWGRDSAATGGFLSDALEFVVR